MVTIEYNMDEAPNGGIGFVLFPLEGITVTRHKAGHVTAIFVDHCAGCTTRVWLDKRVLDTMLQLASMSAYPDQTITVELEPEEGELMAELRQKASE